MSVLPDHCVKRPRKQLMSMRRRMPAVRTRSMYERFECSSSICTVVCICANSALTNSDSGSPSPWYLARMLNASSLRSLPISQRGLSGMKLFSRDVSSAAISSAQGVEHTR